MARKPKRPARKEPAGVAQQRPAQGGSFVRELKTGELRRRDETAPDQGAATPPNEETT